MGFKPNNIMAMLLLLIAITTFSTGFARARANPIFGQQCNTVNGVLSCSAVAPSGAIVLEAGTRHTPIPQGGHFGRNAQATSTATPFALKHDVVTFSTVTGKRTRPTSEPTASAIQKKRQDFSTFPGERIRPTSEPTVSATHKRQDNGDIACGNTRRNAVPLWMLKEYGTEVFCAHHNGQTLAGTRTEEYFMQNIRYQGQVWVSPGVTYTIEETSCNAIFNRILESCHWDSSFHGGAWYNNDVLFDFQYHPTYDIKARQEISTSEPTATALHKREHLPGTAACNNEAPVTIPLTTLSTEGPVAFCGHHEGEVLEGGSVTSEYMAIEGIRFQTQIWVSAGYNLTIDSSQCLQTYTELLIDCSDDQGFHGGAYYNDDVLFHFQARPEDGVKARNTSPTDTVSVLNKRDIDPVDSGTYGCGADEAVQMSLTSLVLQLGDVFCHDHDGQKVEGAPLVQDMVVKDIGFQVQIWPGSNPLTLHYETCTEAFNSIFANCSTYKGFMGGVWQDGDLLFNIQIDRGDSVQARGEDAADGPSVICGAEAPDHTLQQFLQDYGTNLFCTHHEGQSVRGNNVAEFLEIQGVRWQAQVWVTSDYTFNFAWLFCSDSFNKILNGCYKSDGFHGGTYNTEHITFLFQKYPEKKVKARKEIATPKSGSALSKRFDNGDFDGTPAVCGTASPVHASKSDIVSQAVIPFCEKNNGVQLSGNWTRGNYNVAGSELEIVVFMQDIVDVFTMTTDVCWAMFSLIVTNCSADGFVGGTMRSPELHFDLTVIDDTPWPVQNAATLHRRSDFSEQTCYNNVNGVNTQDLADVATDDFCSDSSLVNLDHSANYAREDYTINGIPVRILAELVDPDGQSWLEEGICKRAFQEITTHCLPGDLSGEVHGGSVVDNGNVRYKVILGGDDSAKAVVNVLSLDEGNSELERRDEWYGPVCPLGDTTVDPDDLWNIGINDFCVKFDYFNLTSELGFIELEYTIDNIPVFIRAIQEQEGGQTWLQETECKTAFGKLINNCDPLGSPKHGGSIQHYHVRYDVQLR